jgi:hypothetical protein
VIADLLARAEQHLVLGGVYVGDLALAGPLDIVLVIPLRRPDIPAGQILLRAKVCLRQRGPAEGDTRFSADEGEPAAVTLLAEGCRGVAAGDPAADDHDRG